MIVLCQKKKTLKENALLQPKMEYRLSKQDGVLTIGFKLNFENLIKKEKQVTIVNTIKQSETQIDVNEGWCLIDLALADFAGSILDIEYSEADSVPEIVIMSSMSNFSLGGNLPNRLLRHNETRICRLAIDKETEQTVIQLMTPADEFDGFDNREIQENETFLGSLVRVSPLADRCVEKIRKKSQMLSNIDIRDSLGYLEIQIDAMVKYILSNGQNKDAKTILQASDEYSVFSLRGTEEMVKEFRHKSNVRDQLRKYYLVAQSFKS